MATVSRMPVPVRRTDSDVSPKTIIPPQDSPRGDTKADYFPDSNTVDGSNTSVRASDDDSSAHKSSISFAPDPRPDRSSSRESNQKSTQNQDTMVQRKSSTGSVSFRRMTNPKLPQGMPQQMSNSRIRASSPDHKRYVGSFCLFSLVSTVKALAVAMSTSQSDSFISLATIRNLNQTQYACIQ
jgi:hypothetical protein